MTCAKGPTDRFSAQLARDLIRDAHGTTSLQFDAALQIRTIEFHSLEGRALPLTSELRRKWCLDFNFTLLRLASASLRESSLLSCTGRKSVWIWLNNSIQERSTSSIDNMPGPFLNPPHGWAVGPDAVESGRGVPQRAPIAPDPDALMLERLLECD
ncbi:hypothetical protein AK812_SmicGene34778 [Symbiodinium microadriaticum]|uniref:Uncharacterized protein n=1 Tax=Symbiodinium microadriaticum TaxID=2951 RepID=A0A1Q9CN57_SYMMI|nr:hypothetical protein AK812_SmicGene34778 [Symbiodinium microadriaticum]